MDNINDCGDPKENRFIKDLRRQNEECLNGMRRGENGVSVTATVATSWYLRATGSSKGNNAAAAPKWQRLTSFPCQETRTIKGSAWIPPGSTGFSVCCLSVTTRSAAFLISLQIKDGIGRSGMADPCGVARVWVPQVLTSDTSSAQSRPSNREYQPSQSLSQRILRSSNTPQAPQFPCLHLSPGWDAVLWLLCLHSLFQTSGYPWDDGPSFLNTLSFSMVASSQELWELDTSLECHSVYLGNCLSHHIHCTLMRGIMSLSSWLFSAPHTVPGIENVLKKCQLLTPIMMNLRPVVLQARALLCSNLYLGFGLLLIIIWALWKV